VSFRITRLRLGCPVSPGETSYPSEFGHIRGDQSRLPSQRLRSNQQIMGADRRSRCFKLGAQLAGSRGIIFVEWNYDDITYRKVRSRRAILAASLRATPYHSSYSVTDETPIEAPPDTISRSRSRTAGGLFLSRAMTALVSSR
jgi:hypothetical protein